MEGEQPYSGDLLTMVINHLLAGMILQVVLADGDALSNNSQVAVWKIGGPKTFLT